MNKVVYVTGCLGFIGYQVAIDCLEQGWYVYGVDKETYAARPDFLPKLLAYDRFQYLKSDINDIERLVDCDYIINTAAESHVDNSITKSDIFLRSNINGVHHLLNLVLEKRRFTMPVFLQFSTDEVYGDIVEGAHVEKDLLKPSNPYSATKASADHLVQSFARTFGMKYLIVRPTNNYGIGQYVEKLIPKTVKYLTLGKKVELHEQGTPRRTWLHVSDTSNAIITIIKSGIVNDIFNISGNYEDSNLNVVSKIISVYTGKPFTTDIEPYLLHMTRPGQDVRYAIDDTKLQNLGWKAVAKFDTELEKIVQYYKDNFIW
jgi:dTDP-glucose 4,6-dehydratase